MLKVVPQSPEKPAVGQPCNQCGICCVIKPCEIARQFLLVENGKCPALEFRDDKFHCGLIERPAYHLRFTGSKHDNEGVNKRLRPVLQELLSLGTGCDFEEEETS